MTVSMQNPKTSRLSWDETFMNLAFLTSKRTSCKFHETGAVFVDQNKRIISIGYNGPTEGDLHCIEKGCAKVDGDPATGVLRRCRGAHAEINAIINAQDPTRLRGATLYTVVFPCYDCMKALNNAGVKEIVYNEIYKRIQTGGEKTEEEDEAWELARSRGIIVRKYNGGNFYEQKQEKQSQADPVLPPEAKPIEKQHPEYQYLNLLQDIMDNGTDKQLFFTPEVLEQYKQRGVEPPHIRSVFGRQIRFDLRRGFPLLTTKKTFIRGIIEELLWFLKGDSNIKYLVDHDVHVWDEWAWKGYHKHCLANAPHEDMEQKDFIAKLKSLPADDAFVKKWGDLTTIYGRMWRRWPASDGREIDQLGWVINGLKDKPFRKSYVVSAWNPDFIYAMASEHNKNEVPPFCHTTFQFAVTHGNRLNLGLYQRSADVFLGVPFNIASYALLLLMVAQVTGLEPGEFVHTFGDVHGYSNHFDQMKEQLSREPRPMPQIKLNPAIKNIDDFKYQDFTLEGYDPHPTLKAEIANIGGY